MLVQGEYSKQAAAATVSPGGGYWCCIASVYGDVVPSGGQQADLSKVVQDVLA